MREKNFKFEKLNRTMMHNQFILGLPITFNYAPLKTHLVTPEILRPKARKSAPKSEAEKPIQRKARKWKKIYNLDAPKSTPSQNRGAVQLRIISKWL
jgi:hypothetical protein